MPYFFLLFVGMEILSIVLAASWLGALWTILLMVFSFALGVLMLRHIGTATVLSMRANLFVRGMPSAAQLLWPVRYALAAFCLMSPGFFSTVLAAVFLLTGFSPARRKAAAAKTSDDGVIDAEFREIRPEKEQIPPR